MPWKTRPALKRKVWKFLNEISPLTMLGEGRVYGGGLHKLEPKELGNVAAAAIVELLPEAARTRRGKQVLWQTSRKSVYLSLHRRTFKKNAMQLKE